MMTNVADVNGIRLAYGTAGDHGAPPVVLLHGRGFDHTDWEAVAGGLAGAWRVLAPDLRGHGRSEWPGSYRLEAMRDDVIGLLEGLGTPATLIGHSLGGLVACLVAQERPAMVGRLILEDVPAPWPAGVQVPERPEGALPYDWEMVEQTTRQRRDPDPAWLDGLAAITAPTLALAGGPASHIPQTDVTELAARIPGARLVTVGGGHEIHGNRPEEFLAAVTAFLSS
ncbi:alpha/beta fold hydrolase [Planotetraspora kaengkrachanensis]|uniref:Alpha/beta hydrolase n=1 Tax=Planotetraspora kaengkrachanensis TaxID=575193 RepID=A0A8J3PR63_9ACTN|nr:alpha/beta hydrolase [Planotetraspora kaengkrachanensis]GIG78857.1 alpha/beta hydrolase [Planotetraspora kaengkrachanensis]